MLQLNKVPSSGPRRTYGRGDEWYHLRWATELQGYGEAVTVDNCHLRRCRKRKKTERALHLFDGIANGSSLNRQSYHIGALNRRRGQKKE